MKIKNFISVTCPYSEVAYVEIGDFFDEFGRMEQKEVENFLNDAQNAYVLGKFFYRITRQDWIPAYNGWIKKKISNDNGEYYHCRSKTY